jgi:hypothetical protein
VDAAIDFAVSATGANNSDFATVVDAVVGAANLAAVAASNADIVAEGLVVAVALVVAVHLVALLVLFMPKLTGEFIEAIEVKARGSRLLLAIGL